MQAGKGICLSQEATRKETEIVKKQADVQAVRKEAGVGGQVLCLVPLCTMESQPSAESRVGAEKQGLGD